MQPTLLSVNIKIFFKYSCFLFEIKYSVPHLCFWKNMCVCVQWRLTLMVIYFFWRQMQIILCQLKYFFSLLLLTIFLLFLPTSTCTLKEFYFVFCHTGWTIFLSLKFQLLQLPFLRKLSASALMSGKMLSSHSSAQTVICLQLFEGEWSLFLSKGVIALLFCCRLICTQPSSHPPGLSAFLFNPQNH